MAAEMDILVGYVSEATDDRIRCVGLEHQLTREQTIAWAVGIGLTVLELAAQIPEGKLVYFNGLDFRRITLPLETPSE